MALAEALLRKLRESRAKYEALTEEISAQAQAGAGKKLPQLMRERGGLLKQVQLIDALEDIERRRADTSAMLADPDQEMVALAKADLASLDGESLALERDVLDALTAEPDDERRKVIIEIRAGTGGDEASLFVSDLYRIYEHYFTAQGWKHEIFEASTSEVGGFRDLVLAVEGDGVWRKLKFESGGHRVQRVPATESQGRIHTSAATVAVLPEAEEVDLEINPADLRIETMRAGGAGGQHVNKTESAVRITHVPTGTVAICMDNKSQHKNRASALRVLRSRLFEAERERQHAERAAMRKSQVGSGDRNSRVRTYNWPQNRVTDHRANENYSLEQVLAGKLSAVHEALLALEREERLGQL